MKFDVIHIAKLANLPLTEKEVTTFEEQLSGILEYVTELQTVDVSDVGETAQVTGLTNRSRSDRVEDSLSQEEVTSQTSCTYNGLFKVKAIFA
ncbi:MAG TPA: Asp-tRNA(Asn)/Glu-tRNA(Gln) amidotransferase subunit GatC [Patescibacteria group bacterium]|nr:Asp-tRNA(Asn)/Glu-tRNA(Gln) amidotransferase subunit GatC [Patescibacteria group bacterium]